VNIYYGEYSETRHCACCSVQEEYILIQANTKAEALGKALNYREDSHKSEWIIGIPEFIDTDIFSFSY